MAATPSSQIRCDNCFGTGTVFVGKGKLGVSRRCPFCKGTCKIPNPSYVNDAHQEGNSHQRQKVN